MRISNETRCCEIRKLTLHTAPRPPPMVGKEKAPLRLSPSKQDAGWGVSPLSKKTIDNYTIALKKYQVLRTIK